MGADGKIDKQNQCTTRPVGDSNRKPRSHGKSLRQSSTFGTCRCNHFSMGGLQHNEVCVWRHQNNIPVGKRREPIHLSSTCRRTKHLGARSRIKAETSKSNALSCERSEDLVGLSEARFLQPLVKTVRAATKVCKNPRAAHHGKETLCTTGKNPAQCHPLRKREAATEDRRVELHRLDAKQYSN